MAYPGSYEGGKSKLTVQDLQQGVTPVSTTRETPTTQWNYVQPTATQSLKMGFGGERGAPNPNLTSLYQAMYGQDGYGGGGYGGGGYGGGGGGYGGGAGGSTTDLGGASQKALQAQVKALEAQYGLTMAEIAAMGGEVGAKADFLMKQLARQEREQQESVISGLLQRGIWNSGITPNELGKLAAVFAEQRAQVEMDRQSQMRELAVKKGQAAATLYGGTGGALGTIEQGNLEAEIAAMFNNGTVPTSWVNPQGQSAYTTPITAQDLTNAQKYTNV